MELYFYNTFAHPKGRQAFPTFVLRSGEMFTTSHHSDGQDPAPWYALRDGNLFPTAHHPQRADVNIPWYSIRDNKVCAAEGHPHGAQTVPWFELSPESQPASPPVFSGVRLG